MGEEVQMRDEERRIEFQQDVLAAHFNQETGPSRPGFAFSVMVGNDTETFPVVVRVASSTARELSIEFARSKAEEHIRGLLAGGWTPGEQSSVDAGLFTM